jgi:hypothetical protein
LLRDSKKRFGKPPVLITFCEERRKFCKLIWRKNKLLPLKRNDQIGLQNVRGFTPRSKGILTVWLSKMWHFLKILRKRHSLYLIDNELLLLLQVGVLTLQVVVLTLQVGLLLMQVGVLTLQVGLLLMQEGVLLKQGGTLKLQVGDMLMQEGILY